MLQLGLANTIAARSYLNCVLPWLDQQSLVFNPNGSDVQWQTYTVPTVALPELAPAGCSIVECFPAINQDIPPDDWTEERKVALAARTVERLRRNHELDIAVSRTLSPREFRDDAHLYEGAIYGLSPVAGPAALFSHRGPIRGLYQAGQTTWPGFGIVGAGFSGVFAAEMLIRDESL